MLRKYFAVKCTYNNGGEGDFVGFAGTCSDELIKFNVKNHVWCGTDDCICREYYDSGFRKDKPEFPCMESRLFVNWEFGAGWFHNGTRAGEPKRANIDEGGIAILTTRFTGESESERKIIGLLKTSRVTNNEDEETRFYADQKLSLRLPIEEARQLNYWDYYTINSDRPSWCTGLIRYLSNGQVKRILEDLEITVQSIAHREKIHRLLAEFQDVDTSQIRGLRKSKQKRASIILQNRKYGPGGEGENHKKLKQHIADNPHIIYLYDVVNCEIEHPFCSGDVVDLLFERKNGNDVVVEIETEIPKPGAYQAIKYRALRCAERSLALNTSKVKSVLVAWSVPKDVQEFCAKYHIEVFEVKK